MKTPRMKMKTPRVKVKIDTQLEVFSRILLWVVVFAYKNMREKIYIAAFYFSWFQAHFVNLFF